MDNQTNQFIAVAIQWRTLSNGFIANDYMFWPAGESLVKSAQFVAPNNAASGSVVVLNQGDSAFGGPTLSGAATVTNISIRDTAGATMLVDGAITTNKLNAGAVTAAKIDVTSLSSISANIGELTAGTIRNGSDSFRIDATNGRTIIKTGSFMKVTGAPFGSSSQFIEWYGPLFSNLNSCTEANAVYYLKNDGSAYFGGSLSAGLLRTSLTTSSLASNASIETGAFGSNGGTIQVVLSYSTYCESSDVYAATSTGVTNWNSAVSSWGATASGGIVNASKSIGTGGTTTITLERSINGGGFSTVTSLSVTGGTETIYGVSPVGGDDTGYLTFTRSFGGSLTYTDPQTLAQNRNYRATLSARGAALLGLSGGQLQKISITSTE